MKNEMFSRLPTGVAGLDEILRGGLIGGRAYLVRGGPGTGKTILGLHFLTEGARLGERGLFITLDEPEGQIRSDAAALGFDLGAVEFLDLSPSSEFFSKVQTYDIFSPADVEREPISQRIIAEVDKLNPQRVVLEAMTGFRYLASDPFQYHKQVLSCLRFLVERGATVLFSSEASATAPDDDLQFVSDGVIHLEDGLTHHAVRVSKFRGSGYSTGSHSMRITGEGIQVYPRLVPEDHGREFPSETIPSGLPNLDRLLHGGIERGTVTVISGPSGVGKTSLGLQFVEQAAARDERGVVFAFEEPVEMIVERSECIGIPVRAMIDRGRVELLKINPLRYTPDEFALLARREVEQRRARVVMIDSIAGYRLCMQGEELERHLHSLCTYLKNMGVTVLVVNETEHLTGDFSATEVGISYMTDNLIFLHYLELDGRLRSVIGVLKKRISGFEHTLREFEITGSGLQVGETMHGLHGILGGLPDVVEPRAQQAVAR